MHNGPISGVRVKECGSAGAPLFYRRIDDVPYGARVFQVTGQDCDYERFRLYMTASAEESADDVLARARELFDDSWVEAVDEEDIEWTEEEGATT